MKQRVRILYDGHEFTIPDVDSVDIRRRIDAALTGDDPWLEVTSGFGRGVVAFLRISPGVPIALYDEATEASDSAVAEPPVEHDPLL
ncbi:MAG TPA: hypothetical protein VIG76_01765 [Amnibacterium sp.]|uniref:hypothetical protein n=1 Tax=Amnibacterium sp. TaxID=1872496 RepID=UPI002F957BFE